MRVLIVMVLCLVLTGCFGSGSSSSEEDYESGMFDLFAFDYPEVEDTNREALEAKLDDYSDALDDLNPPVELEAQHEAFVDAFRGLSEVVLELQGQEIVEPEPDDVEVVRRFQNAADDLTEEFAEHYGVRPFRVEGAAMQPSLQNGDHLKVPVYDDRLISRGEIIVFEFHLVGAEGEERHFIKRVIGLPGETIEVRDGMVFVDGIALEESYLLNTPTYTYGPKTVSAGSYFVLGDNRRNSYDSHQWANGCPPEQMCDFVPEENIIGVLPADAKPYASTPD